MSFLSKANPTLGGAGVSVKPDAGKIRPARRRRSRSPSNRIRLLVLQISFGIVIVAFWELTVRLQWLNPLLFSSPQEVAVSGMKLIASPAQWLEFGHTISASILAFLLSGIAGIAVGMVFAIWPLFRAVSDPYLTILNAIPRFALGPVFIAWLGIGASSKIALSASLVFFVVLSNVLAGIDSADRDWHRLMESLGATRSQIFRKITLPASVPGVFAGLRLGMIFSVLGVIVSEMISSENGVGQQIVLYSNTFQMAKVYALLLILAVITTALAQSITLIQRRVSSWSYNSSTGMESAK